MLNNLTIQSYLEKKLDKIFYPSYPAHRIAINDQINYYKLIMNKYYDDYKKIAIPINPQFDIDELQKLNISNQLPLEKPSKRMDFTENIKLSVLYFKQGLEFYQTSLSMSEFSSPLVEYYSFVQCIKGLFLLEFTVPNKSNILGHHGLSMDRQSDNKQANIIKEGVFNALNIIISRGGSIKENYLEDNKKSPTGSLETCIDNAINMTMTRSRVPHSCISDIFITSFILSNLVRYNPLKWQEIIAGVSDEIIIKIRYFRNQTFPLALKTILEKYTVVPSVSANW